MSILDEPKNISSLESNANNVDKLIYNIEKISKNYIESDGHTIFNELDYFGRNSTSNWDIETNNSSYFSDKISENNSVIIPDFVKKNSKFSEVMEINKDHISNINDNSKNIILDNKKSHYEYKLENYDSSLVTHGITNNISNINNKNQIATNNISYEEIIFNKEIINPIIERDNFNLT